jgi:hypothetical protein
MYEFQGWKHDAEPIDFPTIVMLGIMFYRRAF